MEEQLLIEISKKISILGGRVFIVGGKNRDEYLGLENKDIDLEIHSISEANLCNVLSEFGQVDKFGAKFGIYQIKGYDIDFALPRTEMKIGENHTDFNVVINPNLGLKEAIQRRDFTFNGLYRDILTGELIDEFNGVEDIYNGVIRHINNDTFKEDSLRVLRACQFSSRFEFRISDETKELCKNIDLSDISIERVYTELEKAIIKGKKPSLFFTNLKEINKLSPFFNELESLNDFDETMKMIDDLSVKTVENVLALIGVKLGHENYLKLIERFSNRKNLIKPILTKIDAINEFIESDNNKSDFRKFCYKTKKYKEDIFILGKVLFNWNEFEEFYNIYLKDVEKPIVTSKDLFSIGVIPNNKFGLLLEKAMEYQIQGFTDKDKIIKNLKKYYLK